MIIKVRVIPGSKKRNIEKKDKDIFILNVKKRAIEGAANEEVVEILRAYFNLPKSNIRLIRGFKRRNKIFEIIEK